MEVFLGHQLYEILKYCDYDTIKALAQCDKSIHLYCKNNKLIYDIILNEKSKRVAYLTDIFLSNLDDLRRAFPLACELGNVHIAQELIRRNVDLSFCGPYELDRACRGGYLTIARLLVSHAKLGIDHTYRSPLTFACKNNNLALVNFLLTEVPITDSNVYTLALLKACKYGHLHIVDRLLQDPKVDPSVIYEKTTSHSGQSFRYTLLSSSKWDPYFRMHTALTVACEKGHLLVVHLLLRDSRVDPSILNNKAIFKARENNHVDIVNRLIHHPRIDPSVLNYYAIKSTVNNNVHMMHACAGAMKANGHIWWYGDS